MIAEFWSLRAINQYRKVKKRFDEQKMQIFI